MKTVNIKTNGQIWAYIKDIINCWKGIQKSQKAKRWVIEK
jgi:hypothetical protein